MLAAILGLASAACYGVSSTIARRGVLKGNSTYVANVSVLTGPPTFLLATVITGDLFRLGQCPWQAYIFFASSGIIHFALGRTLAYRSIQLIGVNRSNIFTSLNFIVTIILAVVILREVVKPPAIIGIILAFSGPLLTTIKETRTSWNAKSDENFETKIERRTLYKGILYGTVASIFWGTSPILVKFGLDIGGPPVLGNLVAYVAASAVICPSLFLGAENRRTILNKREEALKPALSCGFVTNMAQLSRNLALQYGSVTVVSLMGRTIPIWTLLFAFTFIRKHESFSRWVLLGNGLIFIGSLLVVFP